MFVAASAGALALAVAITFIGIWLAGGIIPFHRFMEAGSPYFLGWRLLLYIVLGGLYMRRWRPQLRALQRRQRDGGEAAHYRLKRIEQLLVMAVIGIEAANLLDFLRGPSF